MYKSSESIESPRREDTGGFKYSVKDIEREREIEKKREKMIDEFKAFDRDSDENITLDEWLSFVQQKVSSLGI